MRSEEFFNILDDMDDHIISEIYEDVQRPQRLAAVPRDRKQTKRLPRLLLSSAACVAVIAAVAVLVRFALPATNSANDSGSDISENLDDWFAQEHMKPYKTPNSTDKPGDTHYKFEPEFDFTIQESSDWSPNEFEIIATDSGTVVFAGKITDEYGSGVIINHNGQAYTAYGGLDPDSVTVSEGDTIMMGDVFARSKLYSCLGAITVAQFKGSRQPITEEFFKLACEGWCYLNAELKRSANEIEHGTPDPDGNHHIAANAGDEIKALDNDSVIYAGTCSDGSGMLITICHGTVYRIYKGLDTTFPDFSKSEPIPNHLRIGDTIGYVGDSGDAYWFVLDVCEFEAFAKENNIATHPLDIVSEHE